MVTNARRGRGALPASGEEAPPGPRLAEPVRSSLGFLLSKAAWQVTERFEAGLVPLGLEARHAGLLMTLGEQGALSQQVLGTLHRIDRTTMVMLVDTLERLGLVERQKDPEDRRAYRVQLTRKGTTLEARVLRLLREAEAEALERLPATERQRLRQLLQQLVALDEPAPKEDSR